VLGALTPIYIPPSHFEVYPTVGAVELLPPLNPNPYEVAEIFPMPLHDLIYGDIKRTSEREFRGQMIRVPYYEVGGHQVWGATAIMISEFEQRLRAVLGE
jgi:hypothetical protein